MKSLRYGIIGGGFITAFQLQALRQIHGVEVAGFVSKDPLDAIVAFAHKCNLGEGRIYKSIGEMIPNVDVIAVFVPNFARLDVIEEVVEAVKAGSQLKAIVCEKPLARTMTEARRILDLVRSVNLQTAYFENQVHMKSLKAVRRQLALVMKSFGSPLLVRSNEEHAGPHKAWFWNPTLQGGGVMSDMGCHCLAVGRQMLTPLDKPINFLCPQSIEADLSLLKWGQPRWRKELYEKFGVDYAKTPAEDYATGVVTYKNPETGQLVKSQFTVSWMYDKQGLRLLCDGLGAGYAFEFNTLRSPLEIFVGDAAADSVADAETALEKSQSSRGLLAVQPNEADLYGYTDENLDLIDALAEGRPPLLDWDFGLEIVRLNLAAYMSAEQGKVVDLTDAATLEKLETYVPLIQQGRGSETLCR